MENIIKHINKISRYCNNSIVIFSDLFQMIIKYNLKSKDIDFFLKEILNILDYKKRTIIMPTFIQLNKKRSKINLNIEKSSTGILSEKFRQLKYTERTLSPLFSYAVCGPQKKKFLKLNPKFEWGVGSHLEWMEKQNSTFLLIGNHPTNCTYVHRIEWRNRKLIKFREKKIYKNIIIKNSKKITHKQFFLSRKMSFPIIEDHTRLLKIFKKNNFSITKINSIPISYYNAKDLDFVYGPIFKKDPYYCIKNRSKVKRFYG